MKRLYFVRHGESELNVARVFAGHTDTPLTDRGRQQAVLAGEYAQTLGIDLIVSSPLVRALETAQIIAAAIDYPLDAITVNELLIEQSYGSLTGKSFDTVIDPAVYKDIETDTLLTTRARAALDYLKALEADTVLIASHGSFGNALLRIIGKTMPDGELPNAEIIQLI